MIAIMPRPRPPRLHREITRHGKAVWYVRIGKGPRIRLRAQFGSSEFDAEYQAAITMAPSARSEGSPTASRWRGYGIATARLASGLMSIPARPGRCARTS